MSTGGSFSVTVTPQPGEFLAGLLLRAEEALGLPAGTTASMARRHDSATRQLGRAPLFVLATTLDLDAIATLLGTSLEAIIATTFRAELQRLFGPGVGARRLGVAGQFRVCPACVRDRRLIRRETILPLVHGCAEHGIWLRHHCAYGARIEAFGRAKPFSCSECGRGWGELPRQPLGARDWLRQRRVAHAYEVILGRAEPGVIEVARRVLAADEDRRWDHGFCLADDPAIVEAAIAARYVKSLAAIVANLVMREIPPERLLEQATVGPHPDLVCHNRACPTHGTSLAIRISAHRRAGLESYCAECGSRFLGGRTILCFDEGNGSPDLSPVSVRCAQARVTDYAMRLAEAAYFLSRYAPTSRVEDVFHLAGVPQASHLRARRLGLVALVARRLGVSIRGAGSTAGTLVDDGFADRWSFPQARIGWAGVYAGEDHP